MMLVFWRQAHDVNRTEERVAGDLIGAKALSRTCYYVRS
uniref:Uncharacterized protein n=1 Tax=Arundo donax TaxID=35708 RepID=A0A0A9SP59_ARUDO